MGNEAVSALRDQLVDRLVAAGHINTEEVAEAFRVVPRHVFLPGVEPADAYADEAIVTKREADGRPISSSSQPAVMAIMLEQLGVEPGQRVLEIGAGTGYNAALLAHLVGAAGAVTTIDIDPDLVGQARRNLDAADFPRVRVVCTDGADGWVENAPYHAIILTAGTEDLAPTWVKQLAQDGRLVLPLSLRGRQQSVAFERAGDHLASVSVASCGFMPLRGVLARADAIRRLGDEPLVLLLMGDDRTVDTAALNVALREPGDIATTGVSVTPADAMGGLGLWLALHEPDMGQLSATGKAAERGLVPALVTLPGMTLTSVLVGQRGLAALIRLHAARVPADQFDLGVQLFGGDDDLARRLTAQVQAWDAAGRPATADLRISAYPRGWADDGHTAIVVDTQHARLLLEW